MEEDKEMCQYCGDREAVYNVNGSPVCDRHDCLISLAEDYDHS